MVPKLVYGPAENSSGPRCGQSVSRAHHRPWQDLSNRRLVRNQSMVFLLNRRFRSRYVHDLYHKNITDRYAVSSAASVAGQQANLDQSIRDRRRLGIFFTVCTWFEILIFSCFGLLVLTQTVRVDDIVVFIVTGLVGLAIFMPLHNNVRANQISRAEQALPVA